VNGLFTILNGFITAENIVIADVGDSLFGGLDLFIHKVLNLYLRLLSFNGVCLYLLLWDTIVKPNIRPIVLVGDGAFK
jgi:indolepyruvate decarboxylase